MKKKNIKRIYNLAVLVIVVFSIINVVYSIIEKDSNGKTISLYNIVVAVDAITVGVFRVLELKNAGKSINQSLSFSENQKGYVVGKNTLLNQISLSQFPEETLIQCLQYVSEEMKRYFGKTNYYELSIFTDKTAPDIIAYYDTNGHRQADSFSNRKGNPQYYRDKKYQVIELLDNPTSEIICIPSTHKEKEYSFTSKQRKQISSQIMYCFHMKNPCVLVVTCNKRNIFQKNDNDLNSFIINIGHILESEILVSERLVCKKNFNCTLSKL